MILKTIFGNIIGKLELYHFLREPIIRKTVFVKLMRRVLVLVGNRLVGFQRFPLSLRFREIFVYTALKFRRKLQPSL
jgi:hypothetical protein